MTEKCYSLDGEEYCTDFQSISYSAEPGQMYYEADAVWIDPVKQVSMNMIEYFLEQLDENIFQDNWMEDCDPCFTDVSDQEKQELLNSVKQWAGKYVKIPYFIAKNPIENTFTEEDF